MCHFLGRVRVVRIRNDLFLEGVELGPEIDRGPKTEITLGESSEGRKDENGIGWKLMRLETKLVKKVPEEGTGRKTESTLEVRNEDDVLSFLGIRLDLGAGYATGDPVRDPA